MRTATLIAIDCVKGREEMADSCLWSQIEIMILMTDVNDDYIYLLLSSILSTTAARLGWLHCRCKFVLPSIVPITAVRRSGG